MFDASELLQMGLGKTIQTAVLLQVRASPVHAPRGPAASQRLLALSLTLLHCLTLTHILPLLLPVLPLPPCSWLTSGG